MMLLIEICLDASAVAAKSLLLLLQLMSVSNWELARRLCYMLLIDLFFFYLKLFFFDTTIP